jgi:hypothetical protein
MRSRSSRPHRADHVVLEVVQAADVVDHLAAVEVVEQRVDGEVASLHVLVDRGEIHGVGATALSDVLAERGDLVLVAVGVAHPDHPELLARGVGLHAEPLVLREQLDDLLGRNLGGEVEVLGLLAQHVVADGSAHDVQLVAGLPHRLVDLADALGDLQVALHPLGLRGLGLLPGLPPPFVLGQRALAEPVVGAQEGEDLDPGVRLPRLEVRVAHEGAPSLRPESGFEKLQPELRPFAVARHLHRGPL